MWMCFLHSRCPFTIAAATFFFLFFLFKSAFRKWKFVNDVNNSRLKAKIFDVRTYKNIYRRGSSRKGCRLTPSAFQTEASPMAALHCRSPHVQQHLPLKSYTLGLWCKRLSQTRSFVLFFLTSPTRETFLFLYENETWKICGPPAHQFPSVPGHLWNCLNLVQRMGRSSMTAWNKNVYILLNLPCCSRV